LQKQQQHFAEKPESDGRSFVLKRLERVEESNTEGTD